MTKIKMFFSTWNEEEINNFIKDKKIIDIKPTMVTDRDGQLLERIMVIYEE